MSEVYHLIFNPVSGKRKSRRALRKVERFLTKRRVPYVTHITYNIEDASKVVGELSKKPVNLIFLGGDGTLNHAVSYISDFNNVTMGIIPCGTGNDFYESLNLPKKPAEAMKHILNSEPKYIDVLDFGSRKCINVAGTGLDIEVLKETEKIKILKGKIKYYVALLRTVLKFSHYDLHLTVDGAERDVEALLIAAANGKYFGGGIKVSPGAELGDGLMDVVIVHKVPKKKILGLLGKFKKGKHDEIKEYIEHIPAKSLKVTGCGRIQTDGEISGIPFECRVLERALKVWY